MDFKIAFNFLKKLNKNNNREWFEKHKDEYLDIKRSFEDFVADLHHELCTFDESLAGLEPRNFIFRIYRDVRFSKDKRPYKKNLSAGFSAQGRTMGSPGYYFHIEPGNNSFVGVGLYSPQPELLSKVRQEIDYNGDQLENVFNGTSFRKLYSGFWDGDALKTMPKGYTKDHPHVQWLKLKSFIVTHSFSDAEVEDKKFLKQVVKAMKTAKPLNEFLKQAVD